MNKIIAKNQWDEKWLREALWMPFGSLMNSYAQTNQQKGITLEEFEKVAKKAFALSMRFTEQAFNRVITSSQTEKELDLPQKNEN